MGLNGGMNLVRVVSSSAQSQALSRVSGYHTRLVITALCLLRAVTLFDSNWASNSSWLDSDFHLGATNAEQVTGRRPVGREGGPGQGDADHIWIPRRLLEEVGCGCGVTAAGLRSGGLVVRRRCCRCEPEAVGKK